MQLLNDTPFIGVPVMGRAGFPGHSLTFVVKGTFDLVAGSSAVASDEQWFPTGDEFYPDDAQMRGGPRYASDFACFKPRADLLLAGTCHAPGGRPLARCPVVFQVGDRRRELAVVGDRTWQRTEPQPFIRMPLRYEHSFGGTGYDKNPAGKGLEAITGLEGRTITPLPNIEDPGNRILSPDQRPEPAGFAPLHQSWTQRASKLGTYDADYLEERWPWFARDFDWGFFNAAPPEMQVEGYLRGDEPLYFENLHPEHPQLRAALPGLRLRCFVDRAATGAEPAAFHEIAMRLDTLWADVDALKLVLVWRGLAKTASEEPDEIAHVFVASEKLSEPLESVDYYRALFERRVLELEQEGEIELVEPQPAEAEAVEVETLDAVIARAEQEAGQRLRAAGIDPANLPPPDAQALEQEAQLLEALGFEAVAPAAGAATRTSIEARVAAGESLAEEDLSELDLSGLQLDGVDLHDANLTNAVLRNAALSQANLSGANMAGVDLSHSKLRGADLTGSDLSGSRLTGADLAGASLAGASFEGADLTGAVLTGVGAEDALFTGADLTQISARDAVFNGADFSAGKLHRADLRGCALREASFEGSVGQRIDLCGADLSELRAAGCDFSYGLFIQARGADSSWEEAILSGADFRHAHLEGVDFTAASMNGANLFAANMKFGCLAKARLSDARLVQTNLFQARLEKADLTGANLSGSNLYGAETLDAKVVATTLTGANVKMTKLAGQA